MSILCRSEFWQKILGLKLYNLNLGVVFVFRWFHNEETKIQPGRVCCEIDNYFKVINYNYVFSCQNWIDSEKGNENSRVYVPLFVAILYACERIEWWEGIQHCSAWFKWLFASKISELFKKKSHKSLKLDLWMIVRWQCTKSSFQLFMYQQHIICWSIRNGVWSDKMQGFK